MGSVCGPFHLLTVTTPGVFVQLLQSAEPKEEPRRTEVKGQPDQKQPPREKTAAEQKLETR